MNTRQPHPILFFFFLLSTTLSAQNCASWGSFRVTLAKNNNVSIWWENNETRNTASYEIETSLDGKKFVGIDTLTGLQQYEGKNAYTFTHENPVLGRNTYRVKRIMATGDTCYSKILTLFFDAAGIQSAQMFPNPANDYLSISFFASRFESLKLTFYDMKGNTAIQEQIPANIGKNTLFYNVEGIENGVYMVELKNREVAVRQRIVVMK